MDDFALGYMKSEKPDEGSHWLTKLFVEIFPIAQGPKLNLEHQKCYITNFNEPEQLLNEPELGQT